MMVGLHRGDDGDELTPLSEVLNDDQWNAQGAAWEREARVIAQTVSTHYRGLTARGVPNKLAAKLTRDFQSDLLAMKVGQSFDGMMLFAEDDDG